MLEILLTPMTTSHIRGKTAYKRASLLTRGIADASRKLPKHVASPTRRELLMVFFGSWMLCGDREG